MHRIPERAQEEFATFRSFSLFFPVPIPRPHFPFFSPAAAVGLYNLGQSCCLNSLLQVFLMNIRFTRILRRYHLLELPQIFPLSPLLFFFLNVGCTLEGLDPRGAIRMLLVPCCACHALPGPVKVEVAVLRLVNHLCFMSWTESLWLCVSLFSLTGCDSIPGLLTGCYNKGCVTCSHIHY